MVLVYVHTSLPEAYANWRDYDADSILATLYFQSDRGDSSRSDGEIITCKLSHVTARVLAQLEKGKAYRLICSHARLVYKWSDMQSYVDNGTLVHRDIGGEFVSRNDGSSKKAYGPMLVLDDRPEIALLNVGEPRCELCLMGIANLGIDWDRSPFRTEDTIECLEALHEQYIYLCRKHRLGKHAITYAGQGQAVYNMSPGRADIRQTTVPEVLNLEIAAYLGGRQETYGYGHYKGPCGLYDVSAFYPHIAVQSKLPFQLHGYVRDIPAEVVRESLAKYYCIACVDLRGHDDYYAVRAGFKTLYPTQEGTYYLHHCELQRALHLGYVARTRLLATYFADRILSSPVSYLLSLRQSAENAGRKLESHYLKLIVNGMIGRLGSRFSCWDDTPEVLPPDRDCTWIESRYGSGEQTKMRSIGWRVQRCSQEYVPAVGSQAIAGAIAAYGRDWLWSLMAYAGRENVLCCSTDSLLVAGAGVLRCDLLARQMGFQPGAVRLVARATSCTIASPGVYSIGDRSGRQGYGTVDRTENEMEGRNRRLSQAGDQPEIHGGYAPENSPFPHSYAAVMSRAERTPFTFFDRPPQGETHVRPS